LAESLGLQPWEPLQVRGDGFLGVVAKGKAVVAGAAKGLKEALPAAGVSEVICGEMGHHATLELAELGVTTVELGHAASEWPAMVRLAGLLRAALGETVAVQVSEIGRE
jgi:putative NIF3 family GTP cyclohydrolase 1 type 2